MPGGDPGVGGVEEADAELGGADGLGTEGQAYGAEEVVSDQVAPGAAALDDAVRALPALALEGGAGAGEVGGVLDEEAGDSPVQAEGVVIGADLGAQGLRRGGVALVDVGAFRVVREIAEHVTAESSSPMTSVNKCR